jgi:uncharacterized metal-binding protein YceD (DUF177 family)
LDALRDNLIFSVERWPEAGIQADFVVPPSTLSPYLEEAMAMAEDGVLVDPDPPQLVSNLRGRVDLQLFGRRLKIRGAFAVKIELTCHRCLTPFVDRIEDTFEDSVNLADFDEASANRETTLALIDGQFDLAPLFCEYLWLAWPMKVLCRPDCLGLCLSCGTNLNEGLCSCAAPQRIRH